MSDFREYLNEQLKDPEFQREYDALEPEYQLINAILDARKSRNMTQKQLAERTGLSQGDISKLENGNTNPTIKLLHRIAEGLGMTLHFEFVPKEVMKRK